MAAAARFFAAVLVVVLGVRFGPDLGRLLISGVVFIGTPIVAVSSAVMIGAFAAASAALNAVANAIGIPAWVVVVALVVGLVAAATAMSSGSSDWLHGSGGTSDGGGYGIGGGYGAP